MTSGAKAEGRFGKQDFAYLPDEDVYRWPAGQLLSYHYTNVERAITPRRYWSTAACKGCAIKIQCTKSKERRITCWAHEHVVDEVQRRLNSNPNATRTRREIIEHPFGTIKTRMGATHFMMKRLQNVAAEMALHVLAYTSHILRRSAQNCTPRKFERHSSARRHDLSLFSCLAAIEANLEWVNSSISAPVTK